MSGFEAHNEDPDEEMGVVDEMYLSARRSFFASRGYADDDPDGDRAFDAWLNTIDDRIAVEGIQRATDRRNTLDSLASMSDTDRMAVVEETIQELCLELDFADRPDSNES